MKKNRLLIFVFIGIIALAVMSVILIKSNEREIPVVRLEANIPIYDTEEELEQVADLIVIGSVKTDLEDDDKFFNDINDDGVTDEYLTLSKFYIQKILKGDCEADVITLVQPVCITTNRYGEEGKYVLDRYEELDKNKTYLLYLGKIKDTYKKECGEYAYGPKGVYQGVIDLTEDLPVPENTGKESHYRLDMDYYERVSNLKAGAIKHFKKEIEEATGIVFADNPPVTAPR